MPTAYTYTGQYSYTDDIATPGTTEGFGLMFYQARWYDPYLNRWTSPDSIIPDPYNPLDWDRYSYVRNNPVHYNDPSGHMVACDLEGSQGCAGTGLGGLTPSQIINAGANEEQEIRAIYNYTVTHPDYNYVQDPELEDTGKFLVSNATFLGSADNASRKPSFWDRVNDSWETLAQGGALSIAAIFVGGGTDPYGHDNADGLVYLRTEAEGNQYVGQTTVQRFARRKYEHAYQNPNTKYGYTILDYGPKGTDLDVLEEDWIRRLGGPGVLQNGRHQMSDWRYRLFGGTVPLP